MGIVVILNNIPAKWVFESIGNDRICVEIDKGQQELNQSFVIEEKDVIQDLQDLLESVQLSVMGMYTEIEYCEYNGDWLIRI